VKHAQGTDITRIFDGLNDVRNIIPSIKWAKEAGMTAQTALCITNSPIHTLEYYTKIADELIAAGADEICLKDMAGIGQPALLGKLTKAIKDKHPEIIIEYHGHSGPGLSMASILEVCNNGADIIDTAIEPLSWGKVHPDIISVLSMLKNEGFDVPEINMNAYMKARALTQEAECMILDEPTNHLDIKYQLQIMDIVKGLDLTVVSAIHDLNIAALYCDRLIAIRKGRVVGLGTPRELLTEKFIYDLYEVHSKVETDAGGGIYIRYLPRHEMD